MDSLRLLGSMVQHKQAWQLAQRKKGQRAINKASRITLLVENAKMRVSPGALGTSIRTLLFASAYPPSRAPLIDLKPIDIADLLLETHHSGRVLIVRTLALPARIQSVQTVIEDDKGNVDRLSLYNEDPRLEPGLVLPEGAVLAIKEPFYKGTADGGYVIRVDHPSDLIILQPTNDLVPEKFASTVNKDTKAAAEWKTEGNAAFVKKDIFAALKLYSSGIAALEPGDVTTKCDLLRNRAACNLLLERYENAQDDAESSVLPVTSPNAERYNTKAYYRAGRAAYKRGKFADAEKLFLSALEISPDDQDTLRELKHTTERQQEAKTGLYDFARISDTVSEQHRRLDHADFTHNTEVLQTEKKGRGLFATKDIVVGELILCEKAFSVAFAKEGTNKDVYAILNLNTNRASMGPHAYLLFDMIQKSRHNPGQASRLLNLHDGGYTPKHTEQQVDGGAVVDSFQVQATIEQNCFGCAETRSADEDSKSGSVGVWITASYTNHSCDGNARRSFIGDLMIVHASKKIAKGEEILMPYSLPDADHEKTKAKPKKGWSFECDCTICAAEAKTTSVHRVQRQRLVKEAADFTAAHKQTDEIFPTLATIAQAKELQRKIDATYDKDIFKRVPRLGLQPLNNWLSQAYSTPTTPQRAINHALRALQELGFGATITGESLKIDWTSGFVEATATDVAMYAADSSFYSKRVAIGEQFEAFAKMTYRMHNGELRGFEERYGSPERRRYGL